MNKALSIILLFSSLVCCYSFGQHIQVEEVSKKPGHSITEGDMNNDGYLDVISFGNSLKVHYGSASLDLQRGQIIETGLTVQAGFSNCEVAYINDDNFLDIVINQPNPNRILVFINNQDGTFSKIEIAIPQTNPTTFYCYDLDVDGKSDLLLFEQNMSTIGYTVYYKMYYLKNNQGNFGQSIHYPHVVQGNLREFYDANGDGRIDINQGYNVYSNQPSNPFNLDQQLMNSAIYTGLNNYDDITDAIHADLNADSLVDYVFIYNHTSLGHAITTNLDPFSEQTTNPDFYDNSPSGITNLVQFQNDSDPSPEFFVVMSGKVYLLDYDIANNQFSSTLIYQDFHIDRLKLADFDNNGNLDLIMYENSYTQKAIVALNDGANHFTDTKVIMFEHESDGGFAADHGDIDGDGLKDIVFFSSGKLVYTKNLGNGQYSNLKTISTVYDALQIDLGDIDNDNDLDIIVSSYYYYQSSTDTELLNYFLNDGSGNFTGPVNIDEYTEGLYQKLADLNNDGFVDIVLDNDTYSGYGEFIYYLNNQSGGFTRYVAESGLPEGKKPFELFDLDNNGFKDIVSLENTTIEVYYNNGTSIASSAQLVNLGANYNHFKAVDLDNDGDKDFVVGFGTSEAILVIKNNAMTFSTQTYPLNPSGYLRDITYMDYDQDGLIDILYGEGDSIGVLKNVGSGNFATPQFFAMTEQFVDFKEIKNTAGTVTNILTSDFEGGVYEMARFIVGDTAILSQTTFQVCSGTPVQVQVTNASSLNDNSTWGVFADSCNGTLVSSNVNGTFNISSQTNRTFYIKAIGNSQFSGACAAFTINTSTSSSVVDLTVNTVTASTVEITVTEPQAIVNWEYQANNNASWTPVQNVANQISITGLSPNTNYEIKIRPQGTIDSCSNWPTTELNINTLCQTVESFDTTYACLWATVILPDYQPVTINQTIQTFDCSLLNGFGCDSIAHLTVIVLPTTGTDYRVASDSLTWIDGVTYTNSTNTPTFTLQNVTGCDSIVTLNLYITNDQEIFVNSSNWAPDGLVTSIVHDSASAEYYLGGEFQGVRHVAYDLNLLDQNTSLPTQVLSNIEGTIYGIESDKNGGYYIYGAFTKIGDSIRSNLAHLDNSFQVTSWVNQVSQSSIDNIFVTDSFVVGSRYNEVFAIHRTTGLLDSLHFFTNGEVRCFALYDGKLLVGGAFSIITTPTSTVRKGLAEFNLYSGTLTAWNPNLVGGSASTNKLIVNGNILYVAGSFNQIIGSGYKNLAKISVIGGVKSLVFWVPGFSPGVDGEVTQMEELGSRLIIGGNFSNLGSTPRTGLAMINKNNHSVGAFNPQGSNYIGVNGIKKAGNKFYISFYNSNLLLGSTNRNYLAAFDTTTLMLSSWNPNPSNYVRLDAANGLLFSSGSAEFIGYKETPLVAKFDAMTDELINWQLPIQGIKVRGLTKGGDKLFVSGTIVQPFNTNGLRVFDVNTLNEISLPNNIIGGYAFQNKDMILYHDGYVYLANYVGANGVTPPQSSLCRLDVSTLDFDQSFNLQLNQYASIKDIKINDDKLFFVGALDSVLGSARRSFAAVDLSTNTLLPYSIQGFSNSWDYIYALELIDNGMYFSGNFDTLNGTPFAGLGRFNFQTNQIENWHPQFSTNPAYSTYGIKYAANSTYLVGDFNWYGPNSDINGFCSFKDQNIEPATFGLESSSELYDIESIGDRMHIVGEINQSGMPLYHKIFTICNNRVEIFDTIYNNSNYSWFGGIFTASGEYYHHIDVTDGCDSLYVLNLMVYPTTYSTISQTACNNYTWNQTGQTYFTSGVYSDTILNYNGADSIITLDLSIVDHFESFTNETSCDEYFWSVTNQIYTISGTYTDTVTSVGGCDSIITLNLTINHSTAAPVITQISCETYTWPQNGTTYLVSGIYQDTMMNAAGCDSIIVLDLTIVNPSVATDNQTVCNSYIWSVNGQTYTTSGQYVDTIPNAAGCDSIITLNLTILNPSNSMETQTACGSFFWLINGQTYLASGQYIDTIPNAAGCDSIITLDLTIIPDLPLALENSFSMPSDANNCVGEVAIDLSGNAPFELDFDNGSQVITSNGYSLVTGLCAGIHDLHVTDNCGDTLSATVVIPVDSNYIFNNPFIDSLALDSLGVTMTNCDIFYNGIDTAYIDSIWANGNTVNVIWNIIDSNGSNFDTTNYVLNNGNGVYWLQLSVFCPNKSLGEYFTVTEAIYFNNGSVSTAGLTAIGENLFEIYPNPTNDQVHISFFGSEGELTVYDVQGKMVLKDLIQNQGVVSLQNFERGVYLFDFNNSQGHSVRRVVKQ